MSISTITNMKDRDLFQRCLTLTGGFEGSSFNRVAGNFDGQGLSWGILQWNFGQGTLQPLLKKIIVTENCKGILGAGYDTLVAVLCKDRKAQVAWADSISYQKGKTAVLQPWKKRFSDMGDSPEGRDVQMLHCLSYWTRAKDIADSLNLRSDRALAFCFDVAVQNGSIKSSSFQAALTEIAAWKITNPDWTPEELELAKLQIVANCVANQSNPRWKDDVLSRKLTIANGVGKVHGKSYDIRADFALA